MEQDNRDREEVVSTDFIKCENCGANMVFNPDTQTLYCPHCDNKKEFFDKDTAKEQDYLTGFCHDTFSKTEKKFVFRCSNCGAKVFFQDGETAKLCPFCGTAHVEKEEQLVGLKPNGVLPFSFGFDHALELAKKWAKSRFFAPKKFKNNLNNDNLNGVYVPCFTFDSYTTSYYEGKIGETHTTVVGSGKNQKTVTTVIWRHIQGTYCCNFDDVLVSAGSKFDQKQLRSISPFDTNNSNKYDEKFLAGFVAYHYDKNLEDCFSDAKKMMDNDIRRGILSQYYHDTVSYLNVSTRHDNVTYKYVMLPVYVGNFKYAGKLYNFYVNGSTGKVKGKTPKSILKILGVVFLSLAVLGTIIYFIYSGNFA